MGWAGLFWAGLGWVGLGWVGLAWGRDGSSLGDGGVKVVGVTQGVRTGKSRSQKASGEPARARGKCAEDLPPAADVPFLGYPKDDDDDDVFSCV